MPDDERTERGNALGSSFTDMVRQLQSGARMVVIRGSENKNQEDENDD